MIARKMKKIIILILAANPLIGSEAGFEDAIITRHQNEFESVAMDIYDFAEVGYQEHESSDLLIKSLKSHGFKRYSLLMIVGGALGNLHDRIFFNAVPDFIDFHVGNFHWFIFNVSDIFITLGVISMIVLELADNKTEKQNND